MSGNHALAQVCRRQSMTATTINSLGAQLPFHLVTTKLKLFGELAQLGTRKLRGELGGRGNETNFASQEIE